MGLAFAAAGCAKVKAAVCSPDAAPEKADAKALIVHLAEVDARGLYRQQAYPSMFEYAVGALHLSESEAYVRIRAARVARQFPLVLRLLESNQLHLTAIKLLAPHLTQDNHAQVLERARGLSRSAVERLVAELAPKPDVPSSMRLLPEPRTPARPTPPAASALQLQAQPQLQAQRQLEIQANGPAADSCAPRPGPVIAELRLESTPATTTALSPGRYKVQTRSRDIPRAVVRAVYERDAQQCTYVSADGKRCAARNKLQLHHVDPFGRGGAATLDNLRVVCRSHNQFYAEQDCGPGFMRQELAAARQRKRSSA